MRNLFIVFSLLCAALSSAAQTLADELQRAGIPEARFSSIELAHKVEATNAQQSGLTYVVYIRVEASRFVGFPQFVQYEAKSGRLLRSELQAGENESCCGSPLKINFTRNYSLISFHNNPSAVTALVVDRQLKLVDVLFGFDFHEIAPDEVVFIENMIHFAPTHPERIRVVDLRSGRTKELYPPRGDALRVAFARILSQHLPSLVDCQEANDPCDPDEFDESIEFLPGDGRGGFRVRVQHEAAYTRVIKDSVAEVLSQAAMYSYHRINGGWLYCGRELSASNFVYSAKSAAPDAQLACEPNQPVIADETEGQPGPLPFVVRKRR
jgi:hypothetical protein